ncbi:MAG: hypothetical protein K8L91_04230 [Anaerolineae bacterium]|nr:hypothetical protein [Anaerolineae bacterium]
MWSSNDSHHDRTGCWCDARGEHNEALCNSVLIAAGVRLTIVILPNAKVHRPLRASAVPCPDVAVWL